MQPVPFVFGIFPYLTTERRIRVAGVDFFAGDDLEDLDPALWRHLEILSP